MIAALDAIIMTWGETRRDGASGNTTQPQCRAIRLHVRVVGALEITVAAHASRFARRCPLLMEKKTRHALGVRTRGVETRETLDGKDVRPPPTSSHQGARSRMVRQLVAGRHP